MLGSPLRDQTASCGVTAPDPDCIRDGIGLVERDRSSQTVAGLRPAGGKVTERLGRDVPAGRVFLLTVVYGTGGVTTKDAPQVQDDPPTAAGGAGLAALSMGEADALDAAGGGGFAVLNMGETDVPAMTWGAGLDVLKVGDAAVTVAR